MSVSSRTRRKNPEEAIPTLQISSTSYEDRTIDIDLVRSKAGLLADELSPEKPWVIVDASKEAQGGSYKAYGCSSLDKSEADFHIEPPRGKKLLKDESEASYKSKEHPRALYDVALSLGSLQGHPRAPYPRHPAMVNFDNGVVGGDDVVKNDQGSMVRLGLMHALQPHTDGSFLSGYCLDGAGRVHELHPPKYFIFEVVSQAFEGARTMILDLHTIYQNFHDKDAWELLTRSSWTIQRVFKKDPRVEILAQGIPLIKIAEDGTPFWVRYRPPAMYDTLEGGNFSLSPEGREIIGSYDDTGKTDTPGIFEDFARGDNHLGWQYLALKAGHIIVGLNKELLHGREQFRRIVNRVIKGRRISRLWVFDDRPGADPPPSVISDPGSASQEKRNAFCRIDRDEVIQTLQNSWYPDITQVPGVTDFQNP